MTTEAVKIDLPTEQQIIDALFAVIEERGDDFIYRSPRTNQASGLCYYYVPVEGVVHPDYKPGESSCLFGAALIDHLNMPLVEMEMNAGGITLILQQLAVGAGRAMTSAYSDRFLIAMADIQALQDGGVFYSRLRHELTRLGYAPTKTTEE